MVPDIHSLTGNVHKIHIHSFIDKQCINPHKNSIILKTEMETNKRLKIHY